MLRNFKKLMIGLSIGLFACSSPPDKQATKVEKPVVVENSKPANAQTVVDSVRDIRDNCMRGQAVPIIKKSVFPNTKFVLQGDSISGIETVDFDNGDKLIINNWGCEYFTLTFRFETSRFQEDVTNIPYWYKKSVLLVSELYDGLEAPIDIKKGIDTLVNYIDRDMHSNYANLKFRDEVDFGLTEIRDIVIVESVEKLTDKKFAITISFTTGPL